MIRYEDLCSDIKKRLSEKRFEHSKRVVKRAIEYADIYGVDKEIISLVAIAHDVAKDMTEDEILYYISKYNIQLDDVEKLNKNLVHAKIGASICKMEYNFTEDMVNAVRFHTTGRENMSTLEKIIYLADATEEGKKYCSSNYVGIIKKDIDNGMVEVCKWVINSLLERNSIIHINTIKCYNYYNAIKLG